MRSSTITLFIDTSSSFLYSGLVKDEELLLAEIKKPLGKELSERALFEIQEMFELASIKPNDVDRIVVVNGPGSFTGVRIGVTIAKTFAWSAKKEIIPVSSLEVMAVSSAFNTIKVPLLDARRGCVFTGVYDKDNNKVFDECYISLQSLIQKLKDLNQEYTFITNDNIDLEKVEYTPDILRIVKHFKNKKSVNPHSVNPNYLKRTEAEETKGIEVS